MFPGSISPSSRTTRRRASGCIVSMSMNVAPAVVVLRKQTQAQGCSPSP